MFSPLYSYFSPLNSNVFAAKIMYDFAANLVLLSGVGTIN